MSKRMLIREPKCKYKLLQYIVREWTHVGIARKLQNFESRGLVGEKLDTELKGFTDQIRGYFGLNKKAQISVHAENGQYFLQLLADYLKRHGCEFDMNQIIETFVYGTAEDFKHILPSDLRQPSTSPLISKSNQLRATCDDLHMILFQVDSVEEDLQSFIKNENRIDQKFYYLSPESEKIWRSVINSGGYKQFDECKWALELLFSDIDLKEIWRKFFIENKADNIIMLGAGSVPKDMVIIREILKLHPSDMILNYTIVDYSNYMLKSTYKEIYSHLVEEKLINRVNLNILEHDFLRFREIKGFLSDSKNTVWFIPGGTIGNIDEGKFLASVISEANPGDFLIVGAETINKDCPDMYRQSMNKYMSPEVKRFLTAPLRSVWPDILNNKKNGTKDKNHKMIETIDSVLERVNIDMPDGIRYSYSVIPNSKTVEISVKINDRKLTLFTSTRYVEEDLIIFFAQRKFEHVTSIASLLPDSRYKQFVFQYVPSPE